MTQQSNAVSALVIDDNAGDRHRAEIALREGGKKARSMCQVLTAESLREGVEMLDRGDRRVDAILLNLGLPDASAFDGLASLRGVNADIPIIVLTGQADLSVATEALKLGAADCLGKYDLQPKTLWRAVRCAIARKNAEAELRRLANTDPLTGVLNRRAFSRHLEVALDQARRSELICSAIVFDIDKFKHVNDLYGHSVGDRLLVEIARAVRSQLRETDTVGRIGGDEFAVVAPNLKSENGAFDVAEKIRMATSRVALDDGMQITPSVSIGIAIFPTDDNPADVLLSHADAALYKSKVKKNGPINYYDEKMDRDVKARHTIRKSMLGDLSAGKFYLDYQPIVDAQTLRIVGAEALARWRDPSNKIVAPSEFISIAEGAGWISRLGRCLMDSACTQLRDAIDAGVPVVPISLNVSALQCRDQGFALQLVGAIMKAGLDPGLFNVEITESTIIQDVDTTLRSLELLKDVGIGVHIDDFGTGYSSLSVLKDLPLDVLKVDRSFVSEMSEDAGARLIVEAIADLSRKLEFKTIAEGVETKDQTRLLREIGIDYLQGYHFSRPVGIDAFKELLRQGAPLGGGDPAWLEAAPSGTRLRQRQAGGWQRRGALRAAAYEEQAPQIKEQ